MTGSEEPFRAQLVAADALAARLNDYLEEQQREPPHRGWIVHWELILEALAGYLAERGA